MMRLGSMVVAVAVGVGLMAGPVTAEQDAPRKLVAPFRGEAAVELTQDTKVGNEIVTTIRVRNMASGNLAGFKVQENWYDKAGNATAGDSYTHRRPIAAGEVIEIVLRTPRSLVIGKRNQYQFTHANGTVKPTVVKRIDMPKPAK
jgi:hypothetical protein